MLLIVAIEERGSGGGLHELVENSMKSGNMYEIGSMLCESRNTATA